MTRTPENTHSHFDAIPPGWGNSATPKNATNPLMTRARAPILARYQESAHFFNAGGMIVPPPAIPTYPPIFLAGDNGIAGDFASIYEAGGFYQTTAGVTPSGFGDPVGLVIDQSEGGQPGPELANDANAAETDVDGTSGFIAGASSLTSQSSVTDGTSYALLVEANTVPVSGARAYKDFSTLGIPDGSLVAVSMRLRHVGTGDMWTVRMGAASTSTTGVSIGDGTILVSETEFSDYSATFVYTIAATRYLIFRETGVSNNGGVYIDNLSIKVIPGNHLIQATSTARPILTRHPKSGVRNLLDESEDASVLDFNNNCTITNNTHVAPDGALTADTIAFDTTY